MQRRALLQRATASALGLTFSTRLFAASDSGVADNAKFLLVFLRGGYDAASLLVPIASSFYTESRPNIAIKRPGDAADAALPLSADWGLHPALKGSVFPLCSVAKQCSCPSPARTTPRAATSKRRIRSSWANRSKVIATSGPAS